MTDNPFLRLAESQMTAPNRAKHKRREERALMKPTPQEQKIIDQQKLIAAYRKTYAAEFKKHLSGPDAEGWRQLRRLLDYMTILDPGHLPEFIDSQPWLINGSLDTRQDALSLIAAHLINLRLRNGMSPMDDSLPGEEPTLFEVVRKQLGVLTP